MIYINVESLCGTPETNIILCINSILIKIVKSLNESILCSCTILLPDPQAFQACSCLWDLELGWPKSSFGLLVFWKNLDKCFGQPNTGCSFYVGNICLRDVQSYSLPNSGLSSYHLLCEISLISCLSLISVPLPFTTHTHTHTHTHTLPPSLPPCLLSQHYFSPYHFLEHFPEQFLAHSRPLISIC